MSISVKTFPRLADAAGALSQERGARFLGGGTLVMRSVNEADPSIETIVRSIDPALTHIGLSSGRVELGAGVTMAAILAERELSYLHPVARIIGGPAVREAATVGGNLFAPPPYGDFAAALLALDATVMLAGGFGQRALGSRGVRKQCGLTHASAAAAAPSRKVDDPVVTEITDNDTNTTNGNMALLTCGDTVCNTYSVNPILSFTSFNT